jgi:hypothetical protein
MNKRKLSRSQFEPLNDGYVGDSDQQIATHRMAGFGVNGRSSFEVGTPSIGRHSKLAPQYPKVANSISISASSPAAALANTPLCSSFVLVKDVS